MRTPPPPATITTDFHRVLLVDRNIDALRRVRDLLQANGNFHVAGARDCTEASALIAQGTFDAALVDEATWSESGVELLRAVHNGTPGLAVIVLAETCQHGAQSTHESYPDNTVFREHLGDGRRLADRVVASVEASRTGRKRETIVRWLERDARTDRLTGFHNRAGFVESLDTTCERARAGGAVVGLILMQVCGIADVRESYGPAERDEMLRRAALGLGRSVRGADFAARSGPCEFAVIVENADLELLRVISRRIAHQIERANADEWGDRAPIEIQFGLASAVGPEPDRLYRAARAQLTPEDEPPPRSLSLQRMFDEDGPSVA